ncbi:MAG: pyridoxine 5'-phosphate synthase [Bacteroidota bacterium]|nr:pyridoxine 5'-phosphate synthase [Bacteroidota bacterium]
MVRLSININKVALLRNSRGGNSPDVIKAAIDCEAYGADGITVHPRPDERHIRFSDLAPLKEAIKTELNVEGYPDKRFVDTVLQIKPRQVTLVPDGPSQLTSDHGWDIEKYQSFLQDIIFELKAAGIRTSIFLDPSPSLCEIAAKTGTDRIELYTESYASKYLKSKQNAIEPYIATAREAAILRLGINAGHDLNLENLHYFKANVPGLLEVSIGHALISDALYYGLQNVTGMYLRLLK